MMTWACLICLSLVLTTRSERVSVADTEIRQGLGDFTFVLVHNLSQLEQLGSLVLQPPVFQPQLVTLVHPQHHVPASPPPTPPPKPPPEVVSTTTTSPSPTTTTHEPTPSPSHNNISEVLTCGVRGSSQDTRIVGGSNAEPGEFPWQVSLQLIAGPKARHICGGAVLSSHWVVTAAHCIWELKPSVLSVVAGDHDLYVAEGSEQRSGVSRIVVNKYKRETFTNDIALLQLATPLRIDNKYVQPICLPDPKHRFLKGDSIVSGWGRLSESGSLPHVLQFLTLPILSLRRCHTLYRKAGYTKYIHNCQLCSGYEQGGLDSCQGDSGGPLVCKQSDGHYYLCGIVSWGVGCARPKFPGVYTEVTCFVDWIKHIITNQGNLLANAPSVVSVSPVSAEFDLIS